MLQHMPVGKEVTLKYASLLKLVECLCIHDRDSQKHGLNPREYYLSQLLSHEYDFKWRQNKEYPTLIFRLTLLIKVAFLLFRKKRQISS